MALRLMDLLREDLVLTPVRARTRDEVVVELVDALIAGGDLTSSSRREVLDAIAHRERSHTTGLGSGVAIPHGLSDTAQEVVAALGIAPAGIDFQAIDGELCRIVFVMVVPRNRFQLHVKTLAGVARLLNDHALRERLVAAGTPSEAMDVIVSQEEANSR